MPLRRSSRTRDYSSSARKTYNLTTKWWITKEDITENGMYGQHGILYNSTIWHAFAGTLFQLSAVR